MSNSLSNMLPKTWCVGIAFLAFPLYTWMRYIRKIFNSDQNASKLHHTYHNCCVIYSKSKGYSGWPLRKEKIFVDLQNKEALFEPLLYFLRTASNSLDIAVMMIHANVVYETLHAVLKRGVKVRLVLDYEAMQGKIHWGRALEELGKLISYI